jgi:tRNA1Val (adenine37-N6)-methyltransferase
MAVFAFRDFDVRQANCPLKVSTDAILLGASVQLSNTNNSILDVGTGNGVIALLLASRFQNVHITGIDPSEGAILDAHYNFEQSNYATRLKALRTTLKDLPSTEKYAVVVSNPPYFIDSLPAKQTADQEAKHIAAPAYFDLLQDMCKRCQDDGQIWLILPPALAVQTQSFFRTLGWFCSQELHFHANPQKLDKRWVLCFEQNAQQGAIAQYFIRDLDGRYHADYRKLAGEFHDRAL